MAQAMNRSCLPLSRALLRCRPRESGDPVNPALAKAGTALSVITGSRLSLRHSASQTRVNALYASLGRDDTPEVSNLAFHSDVVPAKAGTHAPCPIARARKYGSRLSLRSALLGRDDTGGPQPKRRRKVMMRRTQWFVRPG